MAQYQITVDGDMLHQLFRGDVEVGRLLGSVLNQVLEAQVSEHLNVRAYGRPGGVSKRYFHYYMIHWYLLRIIL